MTSNKDSKNKEGTTKKKTKKKTNQKKTQETLLKNSDVIAITIDNVIAPQKRKTVLFWIKLGLAAEDLLVSSQGQRHDSQVPRRRHKKVSTPLSISSKAHYKTQKKQIKQTNKSNPLFEVKITNK